MTIAVKLLNDQIKKISETNTLLDMLLEFEKVLEDVDLYAYANWDKGELLEGPHLDRHYVNVKLLYKENDMPDPYGAKRLLAKDCLVKFKKDTLISPVRVKTYDNVTFQPMPNGQIRRKPKTKSEGVWVVEIKMPRRFVDEFDREVIKAEDDSYIDGENLAPEQQLGNEQNDLGLDPNLGAPGGGLVGI